MSPLRLIFMGTPDFAVPILDALVDAGHHIAAVYCQPPRRAGRGQRLRPSPVQVLAEARGLDVRTPMSLKGAEEQAAFAALDADAAVIAAYGLILPNAVLDAPRLGCVNVHTSLLPRWRGAAPIQRAIIAGDDQSGVTIMAMDEGLDTGAILLAQKTPITSQTTAADLHDRLADLGAKLIVQALEKNNLTATPQSQQGVTYATKLDRAEGRLDWSLPAAELERRVRGLNPWPGVWFEHGGTRIKVLAAAVSGQSGAVGEVLDGLPSIACAEDALTLLRVQKQGRGAMAGGDFLRGFDLPVGTILT